MATITYSDTRGCARDFLEEARAIDSQLKRVIDVERFRHQIETRIAGYAIVPHPDLVASDGFPLAASPVVALVVADDVDLDRLREEIEAKPGVVLFMGNAAGTLRPMLVIPARPGRVTGRHFRVDTVGETSSVFRNALPLIQTDHWTIFKEDDTKARMHVVIQEGHDDLAFLGFDPLLINMKLYEETGDCLCPRIRVRLMVEADVPEGQLHFLGWNDLWLIAHCEGSPRYFDHIRSQDARVQPGTITRSKNPLVHKLLREKGPDVIAASLKPKAGKTPRARAFDWTGDIRFKMPDSAMVSASPFRDLAFGKLFMLGLTPSMTAYVPFRARSVERAGSEAMGCIEHEELRSSPDRDAWLAAEGRVFIHLQPDAYRFLFALPTNLLMSIRGKVWGVQSYPGFYCFGVQVPLSACAINRPVVLRGLGPDMTKTVHSVQGLPQAMDIAMNDVSLVARKIRESGIDMSCNRVWSVRSPLPKGVVFATPGWGREVVTELDDDKRYSSYMRFDAVTRHDALWCLTRAKGTGYTSSRIGLPFLRLIEVVKTAFTGLSENLLVPTSDVLMQAMSSACNQLQRVIDFDPEHNAPLAAASTTRRMVELD
ncbi:hypothetical protein [Paracoccus sp. MKU1]|uniref:hypothetical protein n=1 Tax=Paracoccus sp. MKU1 TaxID=1745182 RepID=UPI000719173E|nr:hypothetical protein [Paracoccus sp. MKU1]